MLDGIRKTDRAVTVGLYVSYTYFYGNIKPSMDSKAKSAIRNSDWLIKNFTSLMDFVRTNMKVPQNLIVRIGDIKKSNVTGEYSPVNQIVSIEPQSDLFRMIRSFFRQMAFAEQYHTRMVVPLSDNAYEFRDGPTVETVRMPRNLFADVSLPHLHHADHRSEELMNHFKDKFPHMFSGTVNDAEPENKNPDFVKIVAQLNALPKRMQEHEQVGSHR